MATPLKMDQHSPGITLVFPSHSYRQNQTAALDPQVAYLSPILAFNLNLHMSRLKSVVKQGKETLSSLFEVKEEREINGKEKECSFASIRLQPWAELPRYASHLRASFVKIPECGTLERLKTSSSEEAKDRQGLIDSALNDYFSVDRYLARGDLFSMCINWNCKSELCINCNQGCQIVVMTQCSSRLRYGTIRGTFSEGQSQTNCSCS